MPSRLLRAVYGLYASIAFVIVVLLFFCPWLIAAPTLPLRRAIGRLTVRAWLWSVGIHLRVRGQAHLPAGPFVAVCNHASYVDGIVLTSALPVHSTFLVQHGAAGWPYIGLIIRRMGVRFVNRQNARAAARAVRGLIRAVKGGQAVAIFPEGTFVAAPGLRPFQRGAFFIAAKTGTPVVPAVLRGSRRFFADGDRWPRWTALDIEFFPALRAEGKDRAAMDRLAERARRLIERECGEPRTAPLHQFPTADAATEAPFQDRSTPSGVPVP